MPIPKPQSGETQKEFIKRCMSNETMVEEYDQEQRSAICYKEWRNRNDGGGFMGKELRIDEGEIKDWRYDEDDEVLVADVLMTKSQVLPYRDNGTTVYEFLPPEELNEDNWLKSIRSKAVTDLHPDEEVNYDNLGDLSKGSLTNKVWAEEKDDGTVEVWAKETVYDQDLIEDIKNGKKRQVSIGRFVNVIDEKGEFGGVSYDRKQTDFRLNHLAHVPQGRAGSDVSVRLDGGGTMVSLKEDDGADTSPKNVEQEEGDSSETVANTDTVGDVNMKLTLDGEELEIGEELTEEDVESFQDEIDERLHELRDKDNKLDEKDEKIGKLEGRMDSLEQKVENDTAEDKIDERLMLIDKIREVMPDYNWHGKSKTDMQTDLIEAVFDGIDLEDKSEAYIDGRFDAALESIEESRGRKVTLKPDSDSREDSDAAKNREALRNMYKGS